MPATSPAPTVVILAGPNGAGKSTAAPQVIQHALGIEELVNADVIAQGLSAFGAEGAALAAGRVMIARLRKLAQDRASFAFETTLASRMFASWVVQLRHSGYRVGLVYLWVRSADLAVQRVASRVRAGGHDVPEVIVRRRFVRSVDNLVKLYMPVTDFWPVYENAQKAGPQLLASGHGTIADIVVDAQAWRQLQESVQ